MSVFDELPEVFDNQRLPDEILADGYDAVSAQERAKLKTSQALVQAVYAEVRLPEEHTTSSAAVGYQIRRRRSASPWAMAFVGAETDPSRLTAALTTARLAGVDDIAVVFLAEPKSPATLVALDLCGIEHSFAMKFDMAADFIDHIAKQGIGRVMLFDAPPGLAGTAFNLGMAFCNDKSARPAVMDGDALDGCYVDANLSPDFFIDTTLEFSELAQD